jgi:hypothetical protein
MRKEPGSIVIVQGVPHLIVSVAIFYLKSSIINDIEARRDYHAVNLKTYTMHPLKKDVVEFDVSIVDGGNVVPVSKSKNAAVRQISKYLKTAENGITIVNANNGEMLRLNKSIPVKEVNKRVSEYLEKYHSYI